MTDKMREEFEKWASGKGLILRKATSGKQFYYLFEDTDYAWEAWQAARMVPDEKMMAFIKEVSEQKPEKPDYWSSCSQCSSNQSEAEDIILSLAIAQEVKK